MNGYYEKNMWFWFVKNNKPQMNADERGLNDALEKGIKAGFEVGDMKGRGFCADY